MLDPPELFDSDSNSDSGVHFAPLDVLDFDIAGGLQAYLDDEEGVSGALALMEQDAAAQSTIEQERRSTDEQLVEHRRMSTSSRRRPIGQRNERRRLQLVTSARRHRDRKKVTRSVLSC